MDALHTGIGVAVATAAVFAIAAGVILLLRRLTTPAEDGTSAAAKLAGGMALRVEEFERAGWTVRRGRGSTVVEGEHGGSPFRLVVAPGRTTLSVPAMAPGQFYVGRAEIHTALATIFGLLYRHKEAEAAIDRQYRFLGSDKGYSQFVFGDPGNLGVLKALVASKFDELQKDSQRLSLIAGTAGVDDVRSALEKAAELRLAPPAALAGHRMGRRILARLAMYAVRIATVVLLWYALEYLLMRYVQLLEGNLALFLMALVFGAATVALVLWSLKGQVRALWAAIEVTCFYAMLLVAGYWGSLALANVRLDASTAREHEVRQVTLSKIHSKNRAVHYQLMFDSLPGYGMETFEVMISDADFERLRNDRTGRLWLVRVREGWLGRPWIESIVPKR